ncbi:MAG: hypothetical protein IT567_06160 [Alphaproteobacteria bacterium]|nr:hypothetical protein [Alphaproteobacteria bacterium]
MLGAQSQLDRPEIKKEEPGHAAVDAGKTRTDHAAQVGKNSGKEEVLDKGAANSSVDFIKSQPKPEGVTLGG